MANSSCDQLERLWDEPDGPLYRLRQGVSTLQDRLDVLAVLRGIEFSAPTVPVRAVSLLWYMPLFIGWQTERVVENGGSIEDLRRFKHEVTNELERILGVP